jgi:hypothetical protein
MLDRVSRLTPIGKAEIERENMAVPSLGFYPLSRCAVHCRARLEKLIIFSSCRKVSYAYEEGETVTNWTISFGPEVP